MHIYWTDHMTLLCIWACNVGFSVFVGLVYKCAGVMIGLTPSCSRQVKGDGRKVKQSELELHKRMGRGARGGGVCGSPSHKKKLTYRYSGKIGRPFGHYRNVKKICTSMSQLICCDPISPNFCHYETYESWLKFTAIKVLWFASQNAGNHISDDLHFKISQKGACPRTPLKRASPALGCQSSQHYYIRNPPMQKGWLRPCYPNINKTIWNILSCPILVNQ